MDNSLLIAGLSASSALCGVIVSQGFAVIQKHLDKKHARQTVLRQKYEELVHNAKQVELHLSERIQALKSCTESSLTTPADTLGKAQTAYYLSLIYFPQLLPFTKRLMNITLAIDSACTAKPLDVKLLSELSKQFGELKKELDNGIQEFARLYT